MPKTYKCGCCGEDIGELPTDFTYRLPDVLFAQPEEVQTKNARKNFASFDDRFFVRALLPFVVTSDDEFRAGVWVEVSGPDFKRISDAWDNASEYTALTVRGRIENAFHIDGVEARGTEVDLGARDPNQCLFVLSTPNEWLQSQMSRKRTNEEHHQLLRSLQTTNERQPLH